MRYSRLVLLIITLAFFISPLVANGAGQFENPLSGGNDPSIAIEGLLKGLITFMLGLVAFVALAAIIYGGLRIVIGSATSESEVARAKQIITWAILGLVLVALAAVILSTISGLIL